MVIVVFYHAVEVSCYHFFGQLNCNYVYALLLWGLLLVNASRYSVKVHRMLSLSALTFEFEVSVVKLLNSFTTMGAYTRHLFCQAS